MKTKNKISVVLILILSGNFFAQDLSGISASFVDLGFGTKAAGMGNAFVASANDANAVFWNSAGVASMENSAVEFNYFNQMQLVPYSSVGAVFPINKKYGNVGAGFIYSGDKALKEFTVVIGYGRTFGDFNFGINLKYRYATFGNNSFDPNDYSVFDQNEITQGEATQVFGNGQGFGADFGIIYKISKKFNLGLAIKDFIAPFKWVSDTKSETQKPKGSYNEPMPLKAYLGISARPFESVEINADFKPAILKDESNVFCFGAQYLFMNIVAFRAGTQQAVNSIDDEKYNFGIGIQYDIAGITASANYAYVIEQLGNTSRFSLGIKLK